MLRPVVTEAIKMLAVLILEWQKKLKIKILWVDLSTAFGGGGEEI